MGIVRSIGDRVLSSPAVFDSFQWAIGEPRAHRYCIQEYVQAKPGERVLDIGCGDGASLRHFAQDVHYVGFDISEDYIAEARERWGTRGQFICADATTFDIKSFGKFDRAFSFGVLHHVDDEVADSMFKIAAAAVGPGGTFVTIDTCFVDGQNAIARYIATQDRGRHVRWADDYVKLARKHGAVHSVIPKNMMNIPCTQIVIRVTFPS